MRNARRLIRKLSAFRRRAVQRFAHPHCHDNHNIGGFGKPTNGLLKTTEGYVLLNFKAASASSFEKIKSSHLCNAQTTAGPLEPHLRGQGANISNTLDKTGQEEMKPLNNSFQNCKPLQNRLKRYREIATRISSKIYTFLRFAADRKQIMTSYPVWLQTMSVWKQYCNMRVHKQASR